MRTTKFPLCCGAYCIWDFPFFRQNDDRLKAYLLRKIKEIIERDGRSFLICILNKRQQMLHEKVLKETGFKKVASATNHPHWDSSPLHMWVYSNPEHNIHHPRHYLW